LNEGVFVAAVTMCFDGINMVLMKVRDSWITVLAINAILMLLFNDHMDGSASLLDDDQIFLFQDSVLCWTID
jgi:hypothetical protein